MATPDWWADVPQPPGRTEAAERVAAALEAKRVAALAKQIKASKKRGAK